MLVDLSYWDSYSLRSVPLGLPVGEMEEFPWAAKLKLVSFYFVPYKNN